MTFGTEGWGADEAAARAVFDAHRAACGNFIDTADVYAGGRSEELLGSFIKQTRSRAEVVLATRFGFTAQQGNPNAGGNGVKNVHRALEGSLRRLGTDYIDPYWMHVYDGVTPVEELLQILGNLVRAGRIRYFGLADMPVWVALKASTIASVRGILGPIALQMEYLLVARGIERALIAGAIDGGMAVEPWSPLGGGFLSGKYAKDDVKDKGRLSGSNPFGDTKFTDRNWAILQALREVADTAGCTPAQAAIAWTLTQPGITAPVLGARRPDQLQATIQALDVKLDAQALAQLNKARALELEFGDVEVMASVGPAIFGGHAVQGWQAH